MSLDQLQKIVTKAAKALYDNEKFVVGALAVRADKIAQAFPMDQTVVHMASFLTKRANNNNAFITRSELKDVYNKLYTHSNKFAEHFSEELGATELQKSHVMKRDANEGIDLVQNAYEKMADPVLANALASAFDSTIAYKQYSNVVATDAQRACAHGLNSAGVPPKKIDVVAGQEDLLICQATYDTPKGTSHVLVPIEVKANKALLPTVFLSTAGFMNLEGEALKEHLVRTAGKAYNINVQKVLEAVSIAKNGSVTPISDVEQIVMRVNASKETPASHSSDDILYQQVDNVRMDVKEAQYEQPAEVLEFAKRLTSAAGVAEFTLGKSATETGRNMVKRSMDSWGFNSQVAVADSNESTIFYAVAVDGKVGFTVPVKIANKKALQPQMIVSASGLVEFSADGVSSILVEEEPNSQVMAMASPMYNLKASQLVEEIRNSMLSKNYVKAEEALTILRKAGDDKAYRIGFELYSAGLAGKMEKTSECNCRMQLKTAHSKYVICGHTNLPIHKVYQDKNGDCHPGYRKGMSESAEGGSFLHSRIYFG